MTEKRNETSSLHQVVVTNHVPRFQIRKKAVADLARAVLEELGYLNGAVSVVFVSDQRMKRLNQRFLNHAWATDVLAFPFSNADSRRCTKGLGLPARLEAGELRRPSRATRNEVIARQRLERSRSNLGIFLGEVIISPERARVQAKRFNVSMGEELARYVCHGILHLLGYSNHTRPGKNRMHQAENRLLQLVFVRKIRVV